MIHVLLVIPAQPPYMQALQALSPSSDSYREFPHRLQPHQTYSLGLPCASDNEAVFGYHRLQRGGAPHHRSDRQPRPERIRPETIQANIGQFVTFHVTDGGPHTVSESTARLSDPCKTEGGFDSGNTFRQ